MQSSVPHYAKGCFIRKHITFANNAPDFDSLAIMIQVNCLGGDMRRPAHFADFTHKKSLADFNITELQQLATQSGSININTYKNNIATWTWQSEFGYINEDDFPEDGIMHRVNDSLLETAPSGAYIEDWILQPGSNEGLAAFLWLCDSNNPTEKLAGLVITGNCAMFIQKRANSDNKQPFSEQLTSHNNNRTAMNELFSCECSFAKKNTAGDFIIEYSTLPFKQHTVLSVPTLSIDNLQSGKIANGAQHCWQVAEWHAF